MLCPNCTRLAFLNTNKRCVRCQGTVLNNISVLCENCSAVAQQCSVCIKKIISASQRAAGRGCNCGGK